MPAGAVYVGRPTRWGNPFVKHSDGYPMAAEGAVACFRKCVEEGAWFCVPQPWPKGKIPAPQYIVTVAMLGEELRGKDLACWCPLDEPCHADVLLEWANR